MLVAAEGPLTAQDLVVMHEYSDIAVDVLMKLAETCGPAQNESLGKSINTRHNISH